MPNMFESIRSQGKRLAENDWRAYFAAEDGTLALDESSRSLTAFLLETQKNYMSSLDEDTRTSAIGSFEKYVFPIIRAVFPNLVATELVSVQPMQGPTSLVFYMDFKAGSKKGSVNLGDTLIAARDGQQPSTNYSGEVIDSEVVYTGSGPAFSGANLSYFPLRPLSLTVTATLTAGTVPIVGTDDGNGTITGAHISSGTINYNTGAMNITFSGAVDDGATVSYNYTSEGSLQVPQMDISITSAPVTSRPRKLRARWTIEAAAQMKAVHGTDVETEVTTAMAEEMRFDIDREIIQDLMTVAVAPDNATHDFWFYTVAPSGVSFFEHKMTILDTFIAHSNYIFQQTRRAVGNWIVCGVNVATIIESLPNFKPVTVTGSGVVYMGDLKGQWRVYKDPYFDTDSFLVGHRGDSYMQTGYIYAPWIPLYSTPTVTLDDFTTRKGIMSHYAKKIVNGLFYTQGKIVHGAHP